MHGSVREYKIQPGKVDELVERIRAEFVPMIEKAPGFVGYSVAQVGSDGIVTTSTFATRAQAEESVAMAAAWVKENMASFATEPPRVTNGEVAVRHVVAGVKATYGMLRRFEGNAADADENTKRLREGLIPILSGMPGFASYALLLEEGRERGVTLSAYTDRASAEAASEHALAWVNENITGAKIVEVISGEIKLRHVKG